MGWIETNDDNIIDDSEINLLKSKWKELIEQRNYARNLAKDRFLRFLDR